MSEADQVSSAQGNSSGGGQERERRRHNSKTVNIPFVEKRMGIFETFGIIREEQENMGSQTEGTRSTESESGPECDEKFYPAIRLNRQFSTSQPHLDRSYDSPWGEGTLDSSGFGSWGDLAENQSDTRKTDLERTPSLSRRGSNSLDSLKKAKTVHLELSSLGQTDSSKEKRNRTQSMAATPHYPSEAPHGLLSKSTSQTSFFGRIFRFGRGQETSEMAPEPHPNEGHTLNEHKSSITDVIFERGIFAKGFEVTPQEINLFFNQK